jgi:enoyl-CoA hydratase/carnithine racemase
MSTYNALDVGVEGDVFRIALDRPKAGNAIN